MACLIWRGPTSISLSASSDTGSNTSERVTSRDNSSVASELQFAVSGLTVGDAKEVSVVATPPDGGKPISFKARVRIDTPKEREYYRHGGILQYVLRQLAAPGKAA